MPGGGSHSAGITSLQYAFPGPVAASWQYVLFEQFILSGGIPRMQTVMDMQSIHLVPTTLLLKAIPHSLIAACEYRHWSSTIIPTFIKVNGFISTSSIEELDLHHRRKFILNIFSAEIRHQIDARCYGKRKVGLCIAVVSRPQ